MLNQAFTAATFRALFDYENRKGVYLEAKFFTEIEKLTQAIKVCMADIRGLKKKKRTLVPAYYKLKKDMLNEEKLTLKAKKEALLTDELEKIASDIANGNLKVGLRRVTLPKGKIAFATDPSARSFFIIKQLQYNMRRLYKVKQANRYEIVCQLKRLFDDSFPKYVIRTDIKDFYESVSNERLLKKLNGDALLTLPCRAVIRQILADYRTIAKTPTGLPRGVGISAYLAELYIRQFDEAIKAHPGITFYARYVDDIVVVFSPRPNSPVTELLPFIKKEALALGLKLNSSKTFTFDLRTPRKCILEYLGYRIEFGDGAVRVGLSKKTIAKYRVRVKRSFNVYFRNAKLNEKKARRLLVKRINFLTGNTHLLNNKGNILIGAFHSNSVLSNADDLARLDTTLKMEARKIAATSLRKVLKGFSFQEGFLQRRYRAFSARDLSQIVEIWKYEA
jgi:reverse transcriptase-like protein